MWIRRLIFSELVLLSIAGFSFVSFYPAYYFENKWSEKRYYFFGVLMSYDTAKRACWENQLDLVNLRSREEQIWLLRSKLSHFFQIWLGMEKINGTWYWLNKESFIPLSNNLWISLKDSWQYSYASAHDDHWHGRKKTDYLNVICEESIQKKANFLVTQREGYFRKATNITGNYHHSEELVNSCLKCFVKCMNQVTCRAVAHRSSVHRCTCFLFEPNMVASVDFQSGNLLKCYVRV